MNNRAMTMALIIAAFATMLVWSYIDDVEVRAQKQFGSKINVVVAKRPIEEGATIDETMIDLKAMPETFKEPGSIAFVKGKDDAEVQKSFQSLYNTVALVPLKEGEQISFTKVSEPGVRTGLSPQVAPGRRAISVSVSEQTAVSKLIKPGDRVDLIAVLDSGGSSKREKLAKTLFQDIVVLSVGKNVTNNIPREVILEGNKTRVKTLSSDTTYNTVTVELEPAQVEKLALLIASGENSILFSLRNNDDNERQNLPGATYFELFQGVEWDRMKRAPAGAGR